jgi:hypothetical protein
MLTLARQTPAAVKGPHDPGADDTHHRSAARAWPRAKRGSTAGSSRSVALHRRTPCGPNLAEANERRDWRTYSTFA